MNDRARASLLAASPLFSGLPPADLARLAESASVRRYRRGQILFAEGDSGDSVLTVTEGSLKAYSTSSDGEEFLLAVVGPGESVGELCLAGKQPRSATVAALTDAAVLHLPRAAVLSAAASSPELVLALLDEFADVIRRLTGAAADLVFLDLPRRVAKLLLAQRETTGSDVITWPLTQAELATRVGASRQSLNAALRDFQRRGWTSTQGHEITILDARALRAFVGD